MKLEVGKFYKNSAGGKTEILGKFVSHGIELYAGITTSDGNQYFQSFYPDGRWNLTTPEHTSNRNDLIEEWRDPIDAIVWMSPKCVNLSLNGPTLGQWQYVYGKNPCTESHYKKYRLIEVVE